MRLGALGSVTMPVGAVLMKGQQLVEEKEKAQRHHTDLQGNSEEWHWADKGSRRV